MKLSDVFGNDELQMLPCCRPCRGKGGDGREAKNTMHIIHVSEIKSMRQLSLDEVKQQARGQDPLRQAAIKRFVQADEFDANAASAPQHSLK